jgi:hypothetical protein
MSHICISMNRCDYLIALKFALGCNTGKGLNDSENMFCICGNSKIRDFRKCSISKKKKDLCEIPDASR